MMSYFPKHYFLHPEDSSNMAYWTKKWGVSTRMIHEAIIESGSLRVTDIREILKSKGVLNSLLWKIRNFFLEFELRRSSERRLVCMHQKPGYKITKIVFEN